jgi:hypothetical protein
MDWQTLLAYITGSVDQALLLRNAYLVTENRLLRNQITGRVRFTDGERTTLAALGQKLGKQALQEVATLVKPDTIIGWHRKLVVYPGAAGNSDGPVWNWSCRVNQPALASPIRIPEPDATLFACLRAHPTRVVSR